MRRNLIAIGMLACATGACRATAQPGTPARPAPAATTALDAARASIRSTLDSLTSLPHVRNAQWGVLVIDAELGDTLYALNANRLLVPASNQKIVTAAAALAVLGPDFRFTTRLTSAAAIRDGTLEGDLVVFGTGDPSFCDQMRNGDAMAPLRELADSLYALGILRIDGALRRGTSPFTDSPIGFGWAWDDLGAAYAATVGDLMFNDSFTPVRVVIDGVPDSSAVRRPAHPHFLDAFYAALVERGITVRNGFDWTTTVADSGLTTLSTYVSPPLREILPHFQKDSQNQVGEILLKTMGRVAAGAGRADSGAAVVSRQLLTWGADSAGFVIRDGSGLSRHNWLSAATIVRVLTVARRDSSFATFSGALPVAGVDGTLERRMRGTPAAGNVRAKTGSMERVRGLSGYVTTAGGRELVFSMLINGYTAPMREIDAAFDLVATQLAALPLAR
jgi:D-alanyl-D-alanine carboxypeptidase/D-alanyl-D-alanine-endopeptidase (penicillin-binding protein 4)